MLFGVKLDCTIYVFLKFSRNLIHHDSVHLSVFIKSSEISKLDKKNMRAQELYSMVDLSKHGVLSVNKFACRLT